MTTMAAAVKLSSPDSIECTWPTRLDKPITILLETARRILTSTDSSASFIGPALSPFPSVRMAPTPSSRARRRAGASPAGGSTYVVAHNWQSL